MTVAHPQHVMCDAARPDVAVLLDAAHIVRNGGLVVFPTETVYGVAAHAWDPVACDRLVHLKQRTEDKPFTLHLWDPRHAVAYAREISPLAEQLINRYWPGPVTLVLPGRETARVGLRCPAHPVARLFLQACRVPVIAPSANRAGAAPAYDAQQALASVGSMVDAVIDSGPTQHRGSSTVLRVEGETVTVLRAGVFSIDTLKQAGVPLAMRGHTDGTGVKPCD